MAEFGDSLVKQESDQLFIHFNVPEHQLKLATFIKTARSAKKIVDSLDQTFFQGQLEYELIVLAPEPGTFLTKLAVYISTGTAAVLAFLNTEIGKAYFEGLTGNEPSHYARQLGESHRGKISDATNSANSLGDSAAETDDRACLDAAKIVVEMTRGVLERENDDLERLGMETGSLPDAVEARNEFFKACISDPDVSGVGFTPSDHFPIPRRSFPERAIKATRKDEEDDPHPWQVSLESIFVTSPNWDKDDQGARNWKGKDSIRRDCFFVIEDEEFWQHVKRRELNVEVLDNLKVQWASQSINGRVRNRRVLRVLEFNSEKLAEPLNDQAILAIIGSYSETTSRGPQESLF